MSIKDNEYTVKISIIIPFYNLENYLEKCLESVLSQDMPDFEIIAVNDGSKDRTPILLEDYAKRDRRIKVVHLENGGISWARNNGVQKAKGEYLMFMDCDDFILPGCLSKLYDYAQSNNADVVIFNHAPYQDGILGKAKKHLYPKDKLMDAVTATKFRLIGGDCYIWNKIIRRTLYLEKNVHFEEGFLVEDFPVSCAMLINSERIFYIDDTFYAHIQRAESTSRSLRTTRRIYDTIYAYKLIKEEIRKNGYERELVAAFEVGYIASLLSLLRMSITRPDQFKSPKDHKESKAFLEERFSKISLKSIFANRYLKLSSKITAIRLKSGIYKWEKVIEKYLK